MIIAAFLQMGIYLTGVALLSIEKKFPAYMSQMVVAWVLFAPIGVLFVLDFNLILLHIYLNVKGMTTFEMVMAMR